MDQLKMRGLFLANRCLLCRKDGENIEHLLLHCPMVWGIWFFLLMSMEVVKPRENPNFLKNGKMVISVKIRNFSRSRMMKRTSPLESSREI